MLKYTHTLYIWIKHINFEQKLPFKNMAFLVSLPDRLYIYLDISPLHSFSGAENFVRRQTTETENYATMPTMARLMGIVAL